MSLIPKSNAEERRRTAGDRVAGRILVRVLAVSLLVSAGRVNGEPADRPQPAVTAENYFEVVSDLAHRLRAFTYGVHDTAAALTSELPEDLLQVFRQYEFTRFRRGPDFDEFAVSLPPFNEVFTTSRRFTTARCRGSNLTEEYTSEIQGRNEGFVFDDSSFVSFEGKLRPPSGIWNLGDREMPPNLPPQVSTEVAFWRQLLATVRHRCHLYRTLNLPARYRPAVSLPQISATLHVMGRTTETISFTNSAQMIEALRWLAEERVVYAGPISIWVGQPEREQSFLVELSFYVVIPDYDLGRHHFLTVNEKLRSYAIRHAVENHLAHRPAIADD